MSAASRRARGTGPRVVLAGACGLVLSAGLLVGCSVTGPADTPASPAGAESGIGSWPTFLPSPAQQGTPVGSLESPAMSYPGSPVVVRVGTAQALMDVEGPSYPSDTKVGAEEVRCTFTVTISQVSAPISMRTASFDVLDSQGGLHQVAAAPHHRVPDQLEPGHRYTLALVGVVPAGEGLLRYYPSTAGAVVAWDYVAETD
jgi:hypothetical protein